MVTKLKSQATRRLGLAFALFLVCTLLMSGAALAQERQHKVEQKTSVKDAFLAEAHAAAVGAGELSHTEQSMLEDTWYDDGYVYGVNAPMLAWMMLVEEWMAEQTIARYHAARSWDGPGHGGDLYDERGAVGAGDLSHTEQSMLEDTWYDDGYVYGVNAPMLAWMMLVEEWMAEQTIARYHAARSWDGPGHGGDLYDERGGQPGGMDVSVEPLIGSFESDMMGLEHNVAVMVPVVLDVVGSTIVELLAESTGVLEAEMETMVAQALLEGLDAAMDEGLITQEEAFDMLMLLSAADAVER
ncbi:MAG: hypothetical protein OXG36_08280 [Caldilineaceae bacterium]|nr:hypothetical protein [Caldilineaceae bacterium]